MATVLRVVGYLSIPVLLISVGLTVRSIRREQAVAVTVRSSLIPMAFVAVMLFVYVVLLGVTTSGTTTWLPLIAGAVGGLWWNGKTTKLTLHDGRVLGAKTLWVLMPWAISMSLTQGLALAESSLTVPVGFTMLFAVSGLVFGENVGLLQRRARLVGGSSSLGPAAAAALIAFVVIGLPGIAEAADYSFERIANGEEPSVGVDISGSGQGYYGDSISAFFRNDTGRTITIEVETGLQLVPANASVQTMLTLGQTVTVPPGGTSVLIKAFCGEMHDGAPGAGDTFTVQGRVEDPDLLRSMQEMKRRDMGDSRDAQDLIWFHSDGNDISSNPIALDLLEAGKRTPAREDAEKSAGAVAVLGGSAAIGLTRTDDRRLLTGSHALKHLTVRGALTRTIAVPDPDTGLMKDKVFVLPPETRPDDAEAIAFTTKEIVDPDSGETVTVIDDDQEVQVLQKPLVPPPTAKPAEDTPPAAPEEPPAAAKPSESVTKIEKEEIKRIVEWGVKNNRTPDEIQRDVEARNETLGGSGSVAFDEKPLRITLPQGEVTVTLDEYTEYGRRSQRMLDMLDNAKVVRTSLERLAARSRLWSLADRLVVVRWLAGTKAIYDQALLVNNPGPTMARRGGFKGVEDMLATKYGKPTWLTYETHKYGSLTEAVEAWKAKPDGGWSKFQKDRGAVIVSARRKLQTMMARTKEVPLPRPEGVVDAGGRYAPARVLVGPTMATPQELLPAKPLATSKLSAFNRPAHKLSEILKAQEQGTRYLKSVQAELKQFLEYESRLARRIPIPGE